MHKKGLPPHIIRWCSHYLCYRSVMTEVKGITATGMLMQGTPQGGVFSPVEDVAACLLLLTSASSDRLLTSG